MKLVTSVAIWLALACLLVPFCAMAQPGVPNVFSPTETDFQHQTHFLTFIGSYIPENAATSAAYYAAINPGGAKTNFTAWLVNAGFIGNASQWHPNGPQIIKIKSVPLASDYGDNVIVADSHVVVLNAADLGFVRYQFIRCKPSCTAKNPIIYTYLENYPVAPFAAGGSGFGSPGGSSYPGPAEAKAAIQSAVTRPLGVLGGDGVTPCAGDPTCIERIADVAFEWAPPPSNPTSTTRFGTEFAYIFYHDGSGITESLLFPSAFTGKAILDPVAKALTTINPGDYFAPNLDGIGFKQMPGLCMICHGGKPQALTSTGSYPRGGNISGFRFLPLDVRNLMFTSDSDAGDPNSRAAQEGQIKEYNLDVLLTVPLLPERDDQGALRVPHLAEVIKGWYSNPSQPNVQDSTFLPVGWREPVHGGTAPPGSESLYVNVVSPSCRTCHFNRELSLDFGTAANFRQESDLKQLLLLPYCNQNNPKPGGRTMPAAHLTFQRIYEANVTSQTLSGQPPLTITGTVDQVANYFGYAGVAGYCATNP